MYVVLKHNFLMKIFNLLLSKRSNENPKIFTTAIHSSNFKKGNYSASHDWSDRGLSIFGIEQQRF